MRLLQGFAILLLNAALGQSAWAYDFSYRSTANSIVHGQKTQEMLSTDERGYDLLSKSAYLLGYQTLAIYGLTKLPGDVTNWKSEDVEVEHWLRNWKRNAYSKPVVDEDPFLVNYLGHPASGMGYYVMARQTGFTKMESFLYSVFESTVIWENGVESFVEEPSLQDLFITPTLGSLWGELNYYLIQKIEDNNGMLYGSESLGTAAMALLSPFNSIVLWTRQKLTGGYYYSPTMQTSWSVQPGRTHGQEMVLSWAMQF